MVELENSSPMAVSTASGEDGISSSGCQTQNPPIPPLKKKRNLPGMPDPDAEVIALSPKTLMATNRFVCEICNKGFQRDQNLQLHRRGHNLPWKLRQRTSKEIRKRVYVCPEPSCVHHNPSRALGDLTGIKKHFCRKHGEKKWKCERCSKKYAVQSDWKAHMKTCGTREYKCDCGTMFARRDSFITHRAFCDALAEESARARTLVISGSEGNVSASANVNVNANVGVAVSVGVASPPQPPLTPSTTVVSPDLSIQSSELPENPIGLSVSAATTACLTTTAATTLSSSSSNTSVFASIFAPSTATTSFSNVMSALSSSDSPTATNTTTHPQLSTLEPTSLSLSSTSLFLSNNGTSSLFPPQNQDHRHFIPVSPLPAMSATALLQKAAQMGAASSNASLLRGFGLSTSSSSVQDGTGNATQWNGHVIKTESTDGLGLVLPSDMMMGQSLPFGSQPMTRDLLGLGIGGGNGGGSGNSGNPTGGLSALLNSFAGGGFDVASYGGGDHSSPNDTWDSAPKDKNPMS